MIPTPDEHLDLRAVPCPANFVRAQMRLDSMEEGEVLLLIVDDGEPVENVETNLADEGHAILNKQRLDDSTWQLLVRRGED